MHFGISLRILSRTFWITVLHLGPLILILYTSEHSVVTFPPLSWTFWCWESTSRECCSSELSSVASTAPLPNSLTPVCDTLVLCLHPIPRPSPSFVYPSCDPLGLWFTLRRGCWEKPGVTVLITLHFPRKPPGSRCYEAARRVRLARRSRHPCLCSPQAPGCGTLEPRGGARGQELLIKTFHQCTCDPLLRCCLFPSFLKMLDVEVGW